jgi:hypothetical protein
LGLARAAGDRNRNDYSECDVGEHFHRRNLQRFDRSTTGSAVPVYLPQYLRTWTTWHKNQTAKETAATFTASKSAFANPTVAAKAVSETKAAMAAPIPMPSAGRAIMFMPFCLNASTRLF